MANSLRVPSACVLALALIWPALRVQAEAPAAETAAAPREAALALVEDPPGAIGDDEAGDADADAEALVAALSAPWTGDLDGMVDRGFVRVGVAFDPIYFSYDGADQRGLSVDIFAEFEKRLRATLKTPALTVALTPLPRDRMIPALIEGRIDLLAANLTITPERAERVDFSDPIHRNVSEIVVTGPAAPEIAAQADLPELALWMRPSSSYHEHAEALNAERAAAGRPPLRIVEANESLEDFDILELVDVGAFSGAVVDDHIAGLYAQVFEHLTLRPDLALHEGGEIAWAMRKGSPKLMAAANDFIKRAKKGTELGNVLHRRWLADADRVRNAISPGENEKLRKVFAIIRRYAETYDFDPILIAAQGYQESRLDQSKRSRAGAVGIMQVMPATARDPNVGVKDIRTADRNVEAGVKYLRFLRDRYFDDDGLDDLDKALLALAAYNAGPGNIAKARRRAEKMGLDPDVWFGNVELAAARVVSREPVIYVRNIMKYYVTYQSYLEIAGNDP